MATALLLAALTIATAAAQPNRFGLPACDAADQQLAARSAFTLCHSATQKVALWAAHELTPAMLETPALARPKHFRRDPEIASAATDADYRNSGFHRGHLVPAGDVAGSAEALEDSFLLSNAVPQQPSLNLGAMRQVENAIRRLARNSDALYVVTGTLFDCESIAHIGPHQISVPCAVYKVVLAIRGETKSAFAVVLPNEVGRGFQTTSVREIESRTGLDFFAALPGEEQEAIETAATPLTE